MSHKRIYILFGTLVAIFAFGGIVVLLMKLQFVQIPQPAVNREVPTGTIQTLELPPSSVDTSNWKTYSNSTYGFKLLYPGDWIGASSTFAFGMLDFMTPDLRKYQGDKYNLNFFATNLTIAVYDTVAQLPFAQATLDRFRHLPEFYNYIQAGENSAGSSPLKINGKFKVDRGIDAYDLTWLGDTNDVPIVTFEYNGKIVGLFFGATSDEVRRAILSSIRFMQ